MRRLASILVMAVLCPAALHAQPREVGIASTTTLPGRNHALGLGMKFGATNGLTMKYYFHPSHALDLGLGAGFVGGAALQHDAAYLYHIYLVHNRYYSLPLVVGGGARVTLWPEQGRFLGASDRGSLGFGVYAPVGVVFNFKRVPVDVFAHLSTGFGIVPDEGSGGMLFDFTTGGRIYF